MNDTQYTSLLSTADLFMVDRFLPGGQRLESLVEQVNGTNGNKGFVMFGIVKYGDVNNTRDMNSSQISLVSPILPVVLNDSYQNSTDDPTDMNYNVQVKQVDEIPESSRILTKTIAWGSAPQAERRTLVSLQPSATVIITDITGNLPLLSEWRLNGGSGANVMFFSWEILEQNGALAVWPYFNYLMYACTFHSIHGYDDALIEPYDQWPHAPLPSTKQLAWWFTMIGAIWFVTIALFAYFKKHSPPSIPRSQQSSDKPSKTGTKESLDPDSMLEGES
ncbi:hypothetical protein GF325_02760 [Candidatus Bathyarchaeota archaeon]|nr:hypothetical protein [Candidatus Bathyarchaeota archaeon]